MTPTEMWGLLEVGRLSLLSSWRETNLRQKSALLRHKWWLHWWPVLPKSPLYGQWFYPSVLHSDLMTGLCLDPPIVTSIHSLVIQRLLVTKVTYVLSNNSNQPCWVIYPSGLLNVIWWLEASWSLKGPSWISPLHVMPGGGSWLVFPAWIWCSGHFSAEIWYLGNFLCYFGLVA